MNSEKNTIWGFVKGKFVFFIGGIIFVVAGLFIIKHDSSWPVSEEIAYPLGIIGCILMLAGMYISYKDKTFNLKHWGFMLERYKFH